MTMTSRVTALVTGGCLFGALASATIGGLGIAGVRSATAADEKLATDEVATATVTAKLSHGIDAVYADHLAVTLTRKPAVRDELAAQFSNDAIPAVEAHLAAIRRAHEGDAQAELADIALLGDQWRSFRDLVNDENRVPVQGGPRAAAEIRARYQVLSKHLQALVGREAADARADHARSSTHIRRAVWGIAIAVLLTALALLLLGAVVTRRLRQAIEPAQEQVEFADTLQLAENEEEAHHLLQRHLQRLVTGSTVTVLNRNNSADRLEAVTVVSADSPLTQRLAHAEPRACLAVRSARVHDEDARRLALLGCPICVGCPGVSTCTPLTVGGEIIGSVLINRPVPYKETERIQVRDAVGQAAPVLANLRNLAIAELRAATDSLTGLPNKRACADTLKRMLAQASRTLTPLGLVVLDLDHFKALNDRFGHQVGDQALASVGDALRSALRESDFAGRNGGEEFTILLPDTDLVGALATAEKIRTAVADIRIPGLDLTITASLGIAMYPDHAVSTERLERLADSALYLAKRTGRDRIEIATPTTDEPPHWYDPGLVESQ